MISSNKCSVLGCDNEANTTYQNKPCCSEHYFFLRRIRSMKLKQSKQNKMENL